MPVNDSLLKFQEIFNLRVSLLKIFRNIFLEKCPLDMFKKTPKDTSEGILEDLS